MEEYLPSVLAAQISPDSEMEALKAQAVIARTYIRRQMGEEKEISELSLDLDRKPREELKKIWGKTISGKIQPSGRGSDPDQWNCDDI